MVDRLLTLPEIAERTRLPISTLRWYRHRGEGPKTFKIGRRVVATEADVEAWIGDRRLGEGVPRGLASQHPRQANHRRESGK
jgi:predicted DNA-binding transcriptional regulator AlpA